jgi:hypothetical protein
MMANKPFVRVGFVGAYLPPHLIDYLRLISFYRGQSNQQTIEDLLEDQQAREPDDQVLDKVIDQLEGEWNSHIERESTSGNREQQKAFLKDAEERMKKKKVLPFHMNFILSELQEKIKQRRNPHDEKEEGAGAGETQRADGEEG